VGARFKTGRHLLAGPRPGFGSSRQDHAPRFSRLSPKNKALTRRGHTGNKKISHRLGKYATIDLDAAPEKLMDAIVILHR
jgi:hypothetical protein